MDRIEVSEARRQIAGGDAQALDVRGEEVARATLRTLVGPKKQGN